MVIRPPDLRRNVAAGVIKVRSEGHARRHFNRHHFSAEASDGATRQIASFLYVPTLAEEGFLGSPELTWTKKPWGIHGTLSAHPKKRCYYPAKRESEMVSLGVNAGT
jgi:hypothetical protein